MGKRIVILNEVKDLTYNGGSHNEACVPPTPSARSFAPLRMTRVFLL
jgi:hypothetical protein